MKASFLVNPAAGAGKAEARLRRALSHRPEFRGALIVGIRSITDALRALAALPADAMPVAVGGDGTVAIVAAALLKTRPGEQVLGVVPLGTGNILAHTFGLRGVDQALDTLSQGSTRFIDVMRTSHETRPVVLVSISAGFEARFIRQYCRLRHAGRLVGAVAGFATMARRTTGIGLEAEGTTVVEPKDAIFSAGLYNTPYYAGGLRMSPDAELTDGSGEAVVYRSAREYWSAVSAAVRGRIRACALVTRCRWSFARITSEHAFQIDGDFVDLRELDVRMDAGCLPVRLPLLSHHGTPVEPAESSERASEA